MTDTNRRLVLAKRPQGPVTPDCFRLEEVPLAPLEDGQVRVRNHFLSLDPYMRGRMEESKSYAQPQPLDEVMIGGTVGEVVESRNERWKPGDRVVGMSGWQHYGTSNGRDIQRVADGLPLSVFLGCVGMPGVTAWYGLNRIIAPKAGETVLVSAASGAVGATVGQLAKAAGCTVIGIAGGPEKCAWVVEEAGFDACLDHRQGGLYKQLKAAAPQGIDGVFENVGGECMDAALARMNAFGRVAVCGLIAGYNGEDISLKNVRSILVNRLKVEGFIVSEHPEVWPEALKELGGMVAAGRMKYRETVSQGLESAPEAFIGLLAGRNFGKQLVKLV